MKKTKILIGVPTLDICECDTFGSIYAQKIPKSIVTELVFMRGYEVSQARNRLVKLAIDENYDYLFFVDSDVVLESNHLEKLFALDVDIATGWYPRKDKSGLLEIHKEASNDLPYFIHYKIEEIKDKGIIEIFSCGLGCALIKMDVFKKMQNKDYDAPIFNFVHLYYSNDVEELNVKKGDRVEISEDINFCLSAKQLGYKILCDTTLGCGHIGKEVHYG